MNEKQINKILKEATKYHLSWLKINFKEPIVYMDFMEQFRNKPNSKVVADYKTGHLYVTSIDNHEYETIITWLQISTLKHEEEHVIIKKILENYSELYLNEASKSIDWLCKDAPKELYEKHEQRINKVKKTLNKMR